MAPTSDHVEAASTLAVIASSHEPLLLVSSDLVLIAASASFCRAFQIDPATIPGRLLADLGNGEWSAPQLGSLLNAPASGSASIEAYELDLIRPNRPTRNLVLNASRLEDGETENIRLLLAISDVSDVRAEAAHKDKLIREKAILLQEVQHRVANSLQIIASVLMQSARRVQSQEARGHLQDAHHRVMSIAALQRQLAAANMGDVVLRDYLAQLCESLGASMIQDPAQLRIVTAVDNSIVDANASVSIGLIVTELVINALKHAFEGHRPGTIAVTYRSDHGKWLLSVGDDGVGMPTGRDEGKPGLGTGIVEALARQLGGIIEVRKAEPGTIVSIVHDTVTVVGDAWMTRQMTGARSRPAGSCPPGDTMVGEPSSSTDVGRKMRRSQPVILVVEDDAIIRMGAMDLIARAGFEAIEASSADEAIRVLEARPDIHLVFTDVEMPGTMDGIKLAHYIRKRWPPIKLIVASGRTIVEQSSLPDGVHFFAKPYDDADLVQSIIRLVARNPEQSWPGEAPPR